MTKHHISSKNRKRSDKPKSRYIRPGALAQMCNKKVALRSCMELRSRVTTRSCTDISKKRIVLDSKKAELGASGCNDKSSETPKKIILTSFEGLGSCRFGTPRTPQSTEFHSQSRLESLHLDLLVKVLCYLHHDDLRDVLLVSRRITEAVLIAIQCHFNYTTPDRSRQEMLKMSTLPSEYRPFRSKADLSLGGCPSPCPPKAPRHAPRPERSKQIDMKQISAVLFQDSMLSSKNKAPPGLPRPHCKPMKQSASNRVLFYEEELCQAVAQNKLH